MSKSVDDANERQNSLVRAKVNETMSVVTQSFAALCENPLRQKLPEHIFRESFLPFFVGQGDPKFAQESMINWIGVAGSPTAPVDIVGPAGETLFTVPPMMDSTVINLKNQKGTRLLDMVHNYNLHADHLPGAAQRYYNREITGKLDQLAPGHTDETPAAKAWNGIFRHYGILPKEDTTAQAEVKSNGSEDLVYD